LRSESIRNSAIQRWRVSGRNRHSSQILRRRTFDTFVEWAIVIFGRLSGTRLGSPLFIMKEIDPEGADPGSPPFVRFPSEISTALRAMIEA
jgi:hypothetical protein